ncbi:cbb3-type cytochrome c oxidase subunit I [Candidatus Nitronereus thalassa]|uniref:Cbb3-type cytochrome c oxidase subunit I n=1 Tax=Candidatus Nitronereus thalassa TaxID=3020898 RepID=A0ABU3KBD4_9BACT|nr:cbb3-type cytochrome c oxidase subunit I [Candidatus Nitronereus thalassa]MDT7043751.1 cbb3-type cytochrome c oxidase subunit I [Candidatus Nitronereus thalassa]
MSTSALVSKPLVRLWGWWALIWLTVFPIVGILVSIKFHNPNFLSETSWFTFGRLRPVHVNGVIFGSFSTSFIALLYYAVPRLCGVRLYKEAWGFWLLWLWNAFLVFGSASLLLGYNLGLEAAEFEWPLNLLRFFIFACIGIQILGTVFRRKEPRFYVSLWYATAALVWTLFNLILGNVVLPYSDEITGVNSAAMHGLYIHYIVGLWLTPAGLAIIYYFLPLSTKQPLFSHKLSLLGFWSLALFYPFVGTHHYLFSPIPYWTQTISIVTSMMLIIPVWTVTVNFFGTIKGQWGTVLGGNQADHYAGKFLMLGAVYYLLGCFQGSVEALRRLQELTHFNDFVIAHSHLTVFGSMVTWVVGGLYYVWPRVTGRQLWSAKLASWHLWLTIVGFTIMAVGLTAQGFIQGSMLEYGANFVDSMEEMKPWWVSRTLGGLAMDIALALMVINFYQTARKGVALEETQTHIAPESEHPVRPYTKPNWLETPSTIVVAAGIGFFSLAVLTQGIIPLLMAETRETTVQNVVTESTVQVATYSPEEQRGREVYIREGCWYCHSQYIRPVTGERFRWGPVSQAGEYAHDRPHLFSTRRIGPDLTRVGRKYGDDWHIAHHWNPREVVPNSIMPKFPWLFTEGEDSSFVLNEDGKALLTYIQRLGTSIGDWREGFVSTRLVKGAALQSSPQGQADLFNLGRRVYELRCIGCHGEKGDGKGPAAKFLNPKPRDFTRGMFKFHSTAGQNSLPTDADLFVTITHGLWGTAMPPWYSLPERERWAVIHYIKSFSDRWENEKVPSPITVPLEPPVTATSLQEGATLFDTHCKLCHGAKGLGDGILAGQVNDVWGSPIQPANFVLPAGEPGGVKLGHDSQHLFTTIMTGVGGDPMPAFQEQLSVKQVWKIVHFVQSLRVNAQMKTLLASDLPTEKVEDARRRIWASLSTSANNGKLEDDVVILPESQPMSSIQTMKTGEQEDSTQKEEHAL